MVRIHVGQPIFPLPPPPTIFNAPMAGPPILGLARLWRDDLDLATMDPVFRVAEWISDHGFTDGLGRPSETWWQGGEDQGRASGARLCRPSGAFECGRLPGEGMARGSMRSLGGAPHSHHAYENPKAVEEGVSGIPFETGAPSEHDGVDGVEKPYEHEGAGGAQPTDQAETENAHEHADHFNGFQVPQNERIHPASLPEIAPARQPEFGGGAPRRARKAAPHGNRRPRLGARFVASIRDCRTGTPATRHEIYLFDRRPGSHTNCMRAHHQTSVSGGHGAPAPGSGTSFGSLAQDGAVGELAQLAGSSPNLPRHRFGGSQKRSSGIGFQPSPKRISACRRRPLQPPNRLCAPLHDAC